MLPWGGRFRTRRQSSDRLDGAGSETAATERRVGMREEIEFGPEILASPEASLSREWLETNGIGGFASSTIWGMNTRRYHGLLTAATEPPVGRMVLLSKLEETVVLGEERFDLSTNRYPGVLHPRGFQYLVNFRLD